MNPPPDRGGRARYGGAAGSAAFPFLVDPTEGPVGASVRAFFPAPEGGGEPPSSSSAERRQRYGGAEQISLGHGMHRYHQFGVEGTRQDGATSGSLPRHSSSPPGFFSGPVVDNGFPSTRVGVGGGSEVHQATSSYNKKMKSPVILPRQGTLTQISEDGVPNHIESMHAIGHSEENIATSNVVRSFSGGFSIGSWEDSNSIAFSSSSSKAGVHHNDDIIATLSNYELQFGAKEATGVDKYLQVQQDQVPFRVRAKRGCATHPRSIAERERRTRISEKLRKLQALVPNMDKQTSTADMLDLAVEHIRGLQSELQVLREEREKCGCRGKHPSGN